MARPAIQSIKLSEHLTLSECHPDSECRTVNWWLYDKRAGMNLGMRCATREGALLEALDYWSTRAINLERLHADLRHKVDSFVSQFSENEAEDD